MTEQWLEDPPRSWEDAHNDPPVTEDRLAVERYTNGLMIEDPDTDAIGAFIYAWEGAVSLDGHDDIVGGEP